MIAGADDTNGDDEGEEEVSRATTVLSHLLGLESSFIIHDLHFLVLFNVYNFTAICLLQQFSVMVTSP